MRTDPIFRVRDQPNSREPLVESERRVLKDRSNLDGELLLTRLALPEPASRQVGVSEAVAFRADRTVGPAEFGYELGAYVEIGEVANCLKQVGRQLVGLAHRVSLLRHPRC